MGLAEIVRTRRRPPLYELALGAHAVGLEALREASRLKGARLLLRAAPAIVAALEGDEVALAAYARGAVYPLRLVADPAVSYVIEEVGK